MNPDDFGQVFADILREEIDREIITELRVAQLTEKGWTSVFIYDLDADGIGPWLSDNIRGEWRAFTSRWMFELENDAILFKLRWS